MPPKKKMRKNYVGEVANVLNFLQSKNSTPAKKSPIKKAPSKKSSKKTSSSSLSPSSPTPSKTSPKKTSSKKTSSFLSPTHSSKKSSFQNEEDADFFLERINIKADRLDFHKQKLSLLKKICLHYFHFWGVSLKETKTELELYYNKHLFSTFDKKDLVFSYFRKINIKQPAIDHFLFLSLIYFLSNEWIRNKDAEFDIDTDYMLPENYMDLITFENDENNHLNKIYIITKSALKNCILKKGLSILCK